MTGIIDTDALQKLGVSSAAVVNKKKNDELLQEDFLKLMTAQLKNQDPFKPMESGDFLGQIAQFGTVSGIKDLQQSFNSFAGSLTSNQALQASMLVGRSVSVLSDTAQLNPGGNVTGTIELPASTGALSLEVVDERGQTVRQINFGARAAGSLGFTWDGMTDKGVAAIPGTYTIRASARVDGDIKALDTYMENRVESVTLGKLGSGPTLNVAGVGPISFDDVKQIK